MAIISAVRTVRNFWLLIESKATFIFSDTRILQLSSTKIAI
jgi:hypothetical protein